MTSEEIRLIQSRFHGKTILLDFDGTLADSFSAIVDIYNDILCPKFHCLPISWSQVEKYRRGNPYDFMNDFKISKLRIPEMVLMARKILNDQIETIKLHEGWENILPQMHQRGYEWGLLTSNSLANVKKFLEAHGILPYFTHFHTGKHIFGKHHILNRFYKKHDLKPTDVLYIGDESRDIEAAEKSGSPFVGVSWGFQSAISLEKSHPLAILKSPEELGSLLK